jgi:hypothetical protein
MAGTEPISQCRSWGSGWFMNADGQWVFRGGWSDSIGYESSYPDSVSPWELNPERYRTRFYEDSLSPEEFERRRRAQLDSMDAARERRWRDTLNMSPPIRPMPPTDTIALPRADDAEPDEPPVEEPADTTGL